MSYRVGRAWAAGKDTRLKDEIRPQRDVLNVEKACDTGFDNMKHTQWGLYLHRQ
jgi:hypothetical protein